MRNRLPTLALALGLLAAAAPEPAAAAPGIGQFVVRCPYSHTLRDDPILFPGLPGASHSHDFFGNVTVDASSTYDSMVLGATTCRVPSDTAGYWTPTAYLDGEPIVPPVMRIYYLGHPTARVETIPAGLQMIGGNRDATSPEENPHVRWSCGQTTEVRTPLEPAPYDCTPWAGYRFVDGVVAHIDFPRCWDGAGLTPEHVVYEVNGVCPAGFRHVLPELSERVHFHVMDPTGPDGSVRLTLSSGPYYTMHGDFWNTWQQPRLDQLVRDCILARVHCGGLFEGAEMSWAQGFGTGAADAALAVAADASGAAVAGWTEGALPGKRSLGGRDGFVRRYDDEGRVSWTRQFGTPGSDEATAVAADRTGVYVAGTTTGRFPGERRAGGEDVFVRRYSPDGRLLWQLQLGTSAADRAATIAVDGGSVWVAGTTWGRFPGERRGGGADAFVVRLDDGGVVRWVRQLGGPGDDRGLAVDALEGRAYVAGATDGGLAGEPPVGGTDGFVAAVRTTGSLAWVDRIATPGLDEARGVAVGRRALYVAGMTDGALGEGGAGMQDAFVRRYLPGGAERWTRRFGTPGDDTATAVDVRGAAVHVAGTTAGALPGQASAGEADAFVRRFDTKGVDLWTVQFGTAASDEALGVGLDASGVWVAGLTWGAFGGAAAAGDADAFLARLRFV
ncbi:MAG TPA: DUF1996 domain-containing protein [Actinomycetota bacterium]|nr:DUF1996 domain-containing protein [Actinomycetota bacterium]